MWCFLIRIYLALMRIQSLERAFALLLGFLHPMSVMLYGSAYRLLVLTSLLVCGHNLDVFSNQKILSVSKRFSHELTKI